MGLNLSPLLSGGNLGGALALRAAAADPIPLVFQLLIVPVLENTVRGREQTRAVGHTREDAVVPHYVPP